MNMLTQIRDLWHRASFDALRVPAPLASLAELDKFGLLTHEAVPAEPRLFDRRVAPPAPTGVALPAGDVSLVCYRSQADLEDQLRQSDQYARTADLTLLLVLDDRFRGDLPALVGRRHPAARLVLSSMNGRLPLGVTIGDLALRAGGLGWRQIAFDADAHRACRDVIQGVTSSELCLVLWPATDAPTGEAVARGVTPP
jgi:hypothetical protein